MLKLKLCIALIVLTVSTTAFAAENINVFAAASLKNAFDAVNASWKADSTHEATLTYAASNALAKQIENGAPADVFISADLTWMKYLADKNLLAPNSQVNLLGNQIVLVAKSDSKIEIKIEPDFKLAEVLGDNKLAMANVDSVPAGKYGKAALEKFNIWSAVEGGASHEGIACN